MAKLKGLYRIKSDNNFFTKTHRTFLYEAHEAVGETLAIFPVQTAKTGKVVTFKQQTRYCTRAYLEDLERVA